MGSMDGIDDKSPPMTDEEAEEYLRQLGDGTVDVGFHLERKPWPVAFKAVAWIIIGLLVAGTATLLLI